MLNHPCTIYLMRHGETEWNVNHIIQGHSESYLTENGVAQAKVVAAELKDVHFDAIFASDLARTVKTAEIINLERALAIHTSEALRERSFGHYEGTPSAEYAKKFQHIFDQMLKLSAIEQTKIKTDDDVESDEEVVGRFITKIREIAIAYQDQTVLVVTHGGPIRTFLVHLGYGKYQDLGPNSFKNSGWVKLISDGIDFEILDAPGIKL